MVTVDVSTRAGRVLHRVVSTSIAAGRGWICLNSVLDPGVQDRSSRAS